MSGGDILTLSFGPYASILSTHFWNATTDLDAKSGALYHQTGRGKSYPRTVAVDWSGGSEIKKEWKLTNAELQAEAEDIDNSEALMNMSILNESEHVAQADAKSDSNEDEGENIVSTTEIVHWWKYITPQLSSRSMQLISEQTARDYTSRSVYTAGEELFSKDSTLNDSTLDAIRYFYEGMDTCQGVLVFSEANTLFGGLTWDVLQRIRDDFGKASTWTVSAFMNNDEEVEEAEGDWEKQMLRQRNTINRVMSHTLASDASSLYVPVDVNTWEKTYENPVQSGAVVSSGISTLLSTILDVDNEMQFGQFCDVLRPVPSMKLTTMQVATPLPIKMTPGLPMSFADILKIPYSAYSALSHKWPAGHIYGTPESHCMAQVWSCRGISALPFAPGYSSHKQCVNEFWAERFKTPRTYSSVSPSQYHLSGTFPTELLPRGLNIVGWEDENAPQTYDEDSLPSTIPTAAHLTTTCSSALMLSNLLTSFKKCHRYQHKSYDLEDDQWREVTEILETMVDEYDQGLINAQ
eukprot:TRINITY_DN13454_c0_g1_i1.p1 TRINITY_DN13454_c0_g1~~TRINITY_DN13454_c0_g1_i1.p1  ORF type:complete len:541 (+),score=99.93 TRINITY_DN13454_c0_g1_i1:60-1625(+)